jgi:hypothetical protein
MWVERVQRLKLASAGTLIERCTAVCTELPRIVCKSLIHGICADEADSLRRKLLGTMTCTQIRGLELSSLTELCQRNTGKSLEAFLAQVCAVLWAPPFKKQEDMHGLSCGNTLFDVTTSPSNLQAEPHSGCCRF